MRIRLAAFLAALVLAVGMLAMPRPAQAQIIEPALCNGYEIGWFCWFITQGEPDAVLDCMDCAQLMCDFECPWYPLERYRWCLNVSFVTCFGDFVIPDDF